MATLNFLRKYFMKKPFFKDGFEYQFVDIQPDEDDASYDFTINVVPPKKGQSYIPTKFTHDIFGMIENSWNYLGSQYSFSENILVNGKKIEYDFIYINEEDTREILNNLNEGIRRVTVTSGRHGSYSVQVSADISFNYPKNAEPFYFDSANNYIFINLIYELRDIRLNNERVELANGQIDNFGDVFNEILHNQDSFHEDLSTIIFETLEPSVKIADLDDTWYNVNFWLTKIEGMFVDATGNSPDYVFTPKMFR